MNSSSGFRWLNCLICLICTFLFVPVGSQTISDIQLSFNQGLNVSGFVLIDSTSVNPVSRKPLYSFLLNNKSRNSSEVNVAKNGNEYIQVFDNGLQVIFNVSDTSKTYWHGDLKFRNTGRDTLTISNLVPFGEDSSSVYITGKGPADLARAWLFRPGYQPVRVILPDNAWEMGYSSFRCSKDYSVCSVLRRIYIEKGEKKRYESVLPPDASATYSIYAELYKGEWQDGLRKVFRDRYIYDTDKFDNTLFERKDLSWIRQSYLIVLQMAWDREFYDRFTGKYTYAESLKKYQVLFGNIDVYGLWATWPRLGLDQRNQWDMYRDLPGGTVQLRNFVKMSQQAGIRFFISYNPWDTSTQKESHYRGISRLISETEADGVILDTRNDSGPELQSVVDSIKKGVIMYSEGMAVPREMHGIISGRVHNAIYLSPELNLNKLIKPDFAIFRVCDVGEDILHREIAIAFFNGSGTELNMFRPGGRGEAFTDDLSFLSQTTFILRQNSDAFLDFDWIPLISTSNDKVYVNRWKSGDKTIFTILNMRPGGIRTELFSSNSFKNKHYISLWSHESFEPEIINGEAKIPVNINGWNPSYSGSRKEGSVDCIAELPVLIYSKIQGDSIEISSKSSGILYLWKGNPSYGTAHIEFRMPVDTTIRVRDLFGYYEGKLVLQLTDNKNLKDENILMVRGGKPWIINKVVTTQRSEVVPSDMVFVPGSVISMDLTPGDNFIPYPEFAASDIKVDSFLIDKYPVTNAQFYDFITSSGYRPIDTSGYLRHWQSGVYKQGQDKYPVVNVSFEDMSAYARWAGKRLPTQAEWQLAAQGTDKRKWPWGNEFHGTYCNNSFDRQTPVDAFPKGQSPYGVMDLVGNVWQMTNDLYFNGTNYMGIIRGGSYYKPDSNWWYLQGGPQQLDKTQILLLVSPGFDRSATVGFRCVKDIDRNNFNVKK
jgi:gamma-glutamyl hercynylcysteine S-oxide synthase